MQSKHVSSSPSESGRGVVAAAALSAAATGAASAAQRPFLSDLVDRIRSADATVSGPAWQNAHQFGPDAVGVLAPLLEDSDFEIRRNATRAIYQILRRASRPGAKSHQQAVEKQLLPLLNSSSPLVRREALWMLSEIGSERAVPGIADLLADSEVHDDARCALLRIPGRNSIAALKKALGTVPEPYRFAIADSLRARGVKVEGYPSRKLVATARTTVEPLVKK